MGRRYEGRWAVGLSAAVLVLAGCGGGADGENSAPEASSRGSAR